MIDQSTLKGRVVLAALRLAAERPWRDVALRDIADASEATLADLRSDFGSKTAVVVAINRELDRLVISKTFRTTAGQPVRDTLFEVVMSRFDAMQPYKSAIRSIVRDAGGADRALIGSLIRSQHWMLQAAGIDTEGGIGRARVWGLASIYGDVFRTWLDDEDPGMARTMAALDRRLRSGERTMQGVEAVVGGVHRMGETVRDALRRRPSGMKAEDVVPPADRPAGTPGF